MSLYMDAESLFFFAFFGLLTAAACIDMATMEIPDHIPAAILILSLLSWLTGHEPSFRTRMLGLFCVSVPMLILTYVVPGAFGGGDIKLMAACGAFLGWRRCLCAMLLAVLGGGLWAAWLLAGKKADRKDQFAFGPFLCLGAAVSLLWGEELLRWYLSFAGFSV
ncbi:MAG: prepilin peptidase [Lachnospiraceae bacterium]|nr:prepilin peptidase [Lachnospiraceae bacterium]